MVNRSLVQNTIHNLRWAVIAIDVRADVYGQVSIALHMIDAPPFSMAVSCLVVSSYSLIV